MNPMLSNPRSELHALQPFGEGTGEVESLLSYFCRLAVSHSVSTLALSRSIAQRFEHKVTPNFDWHQRQFAGIRESAITWSAALSALTAVQGLDRLTFLPWQDVISQNGLSIVTRGQFCPACLADDLAQGREPYFRLAWESAEVRVCARHGSSLTTQCSHCGKDNIRHAAAYVVPGWCSHCGEFLGKTSSAAGMTDPASRWVARQIGELVAVQQVLETTPTRNKLINAITHLITELDHGQSAAFARRIGVAKSTVHHWLKGEGTPTLEASLKIAAQCGASLMQLLTGNLSDWERPQADQQLVLSLPQPTPRARAAQRELDWGDLERKLQEFLLLPTPISVLEAGRRLNVEARQLYLRANMTTRQLGERWKAYLRRRQVEHVVNAWPYLEQACIDIWAEGKAVTRREVAARVPAPILAPLTNLLLILKDVQSHLMKPDSEPGGEK
ncbi:helix-turn-helix domain-containing protein [Azospira oryzae]|uniref:helix-turn-helix domain-containing protein n=1 Tax=Azospira oryzae TaxID=146939 RepID=UPI0019634D93|nr:helix-turn-helix domain-containing protein [Azospira oryzae]